MKKTLILAAALSCLAMLGGCYQAQKQTPSPMGAEDSLIEERTIAGRTFEEDLFWIGRGLAIGTADSLPECGRGPRIRDLGGDEAPSA